jgi:hypothetical protein
LAYLFEIDPEESFSPFVHKDQVAGGIDHERRYGQVVGELANEDQLNGQLGHNNTPGRSKGVLRVAVRAGWFVGILTSSRWRLCALRSCLGREGEGLRFGIRRRSDKGSQFRHLSL